MRAKAYEQFDPSEAWRVAEGFLATHAVTPDGLPASPNVVQLLMVGVWVGCRFALLDRELGLGIAAAGNDRRGLVFEALRLAFAGEFDESLEELFRDVLHQRGFTNAEVVSRPVAEPLPERPSADDAIDAAEELIRRMLGSGDDGEVTP